VTSTDRRSPASVALPHRVVGQAPQHVMNALDQKSPSSAPCHASATRSRRAIAPPGRSTRARREPAWACIATYRATSMNDA